VRLLVASYAYPPLRYPRAIQVARLVAHLRGVDVTVVAGAESGSGDASLLAAYPDEGKRVVRVPWSGRSRLLARVRSKLLEDRLLVPDIYRPWQRDAARAIRSLGLLRPGDVLATFGQPMSDHLLGLRLARRRGALWVAHFSDPWVDSPYRRAGALARRVNESLEERVVREADALVFTSRETLELVLAKYPYVLAEKAHVLPHAHEPSLYPVARAPARRELVVRYVGNLYGGRSAAALVEVLRELAASDPASLADVKVELVGSRDPAQAVEDTSSLPDGLLTFASAVDYLESLARMRESDVLLVLDATGERSVFLPSKLVEYLGARRPIVALTPPGTAADLTRRAGGWSADPADPPAAARALAEGLRFARERRGEDWGRSDVVDGFSAAAVAPMFAKVLERVRARA
jgi:glycosyltransferase involved in cell wall biosynthesis